MDGSGSSVSLEAVTTEIDFGPVTLYYKVSGVLVSVSVESRMLDFVNSIGYEQYSLLFVPDETDDLFYAVSGVSISTKGAFGVVEGDTPSKITFEFARNVNEIKDALYFVDLPS